MARQRKRGRDCMDGEEWGREAPFGQEVRNAFEEARRRLLAFPWGAGGGVGAWERDLLLSIADPRVLFFAPEKVGDAGACAGLFDSGHSAALALTSVYSIGRMVAGGESASDITHAFVRGIVGRANGTIKDVP